MAASNTYGPYCCQLIIIFLAFLASTDADNSATTDFDLKPGSEVQYVEAKLRDGVCRFTYIAQGGTNEKWKLTIESDDADTGFMCEASRPGGLSYLFFEQFRLEILGEFVGAEYFVGGDREMPLNPAEFDASYQDAVVRQVDGKFDSKLSKVVVMAMRKKSEL